MNLPIRMEALNNSEHRRAICLKFGDLSLTSLIKLVLEVKASIYSTIKENLLLYCCKFFLFDAAVII